MEKVREDFESVSRGLDDIQYYDSVLLEKQANEYELKVTRQEPGEEG